MCAPSARRRAAGARALTVAPSARASTSVYAVRRGGPPARGPRHTGGARMHAAPARSPRGGPRRIASACAHAARRCRSTPSTTHTARGDARARARRCRRAARARPRRRPARGAGARLVRLGRLSVERGRGGHPRRGGGSARTSAAHSSRLQREPSARHSGGSRGWRLAADRVRRATGHRASAGLRRAMVHRRRAHDRIPGHAKRGPG